MILLLLLAASGTTALDLPPGIGCAQAVHQQLERWDAASGMRRAAGGPLGGARYVWQTGRLGVWLDLRLRPGGLASLARVEASGTTEVAWDAACQVSTRERLAPRERAGAAHLTDAALARHLAQGRAVVVYIWSPHMPLSIDGLPHVTRAAERLGLRLLIRAHPLADPDYAARAAAEAGLPRDAVQTVDSVELTFRDVLVHAPSLQLFVEGRAAGPALPGYRDAAGYEQALRLRLVSAGRKQP